MCPQTVATVVLGICFTDGLVKKIYKFNLAQHNLKFIPTYVPNTKPT